MSSPIYVESTMHYKEEASLSFKKLDEDIYVVEKDRYNEIVGRFPPSI